MSKLTDTKCRAAKPFAKDYKLSDGNGLYLLVTKHGSKLWKWKYRYNGVEKKLSLGSYPDVSIKQARDAVAQQRALLAMNADPSTEKRMRKLQAEFATATTFKAVGEEYVAKMEKEGRAAATILKARWMFGLRDAFRMSNSNPKDPRCPSGQRQKAVKSNRTLWLSEAGADIP